MKNYVEVKFGGEGVLCTVYIIPSWQRDSGISIVVNDDNTFTIEDKGAFNNQTLDPAGFADFLAFCEKMNALKSVMSIEKFLSTEALSSDNTERLGKIISQFVGSDCINIVGRVHTKSCDYVNITTVRNNDGTLNFFVDVVKFGEDINSPVLSFDIRNGKMCRFFPYKDVKVPVELYHVLTAISGTDNYDTDEQITDALTDELKKVADHYDITIKKEDNKNILFPFPSMM